MKTKMGIIAAALVCAAFSASAEPSIPAMGLQKSDKVLREVTMGRAGYSYRVVERRVDHERSRGTTDRPVTIGVYARDWNAGARKDTVVRRVTMGRAGYALRMAPR